MTNNGHSRHAPRVLTWHNVYMIQNFMEIMVMLVIFANAAPFPRNLQKTVKNHDFVPTLRSIFRGEEVAIGKNGLYF